MFYVLAKRQKCFYKELAKQERNRKQETEREGERVRETASALKIISVKHGPQFAYQTRALVGQRVGGRGRQRGAWRSGDFIAFGVDLFTTRNVGNFHV